MQQEINKNIEKEKISQTWVKYSNDNIFTKCKLHWSGLAIVQWKTHEIPASGGLQLKYLAFEYWYHSFHLCASQIFILIPLRTLYDNNKMQNI